MIGFIEITDAGYGKKRLINIFRIVSVFESSITVTICDNREGSNLRLDVVHCIETYEEIKQKIALALSERGLV